jgi:CHU_C Type IX secretion signal domain
MQKIILIFLFLNCNTVNSQTNNLVPNPSFEEYGQCNLGFTNVDVYNPYNGYSHNSVKDWHQPTWGTSDYFHECASGVGQVGVPNNIHGNLNAKDGKAYMGVYAFYRLDTSNMVLGTEYREYIITQLNKKLEAGKSYCVSFYASTSQKVVGSQWTIYATNSFGAYFSSTLDTAYSTYPKPEGLIRVTPPIVPQVEATETMEELGRWYLVQGTFIAQGGEQYITIGNFKNDIETFAHSKKIVSGVVQADHSYFSYYYIDKVSVYEMDKLHLFKDTLHICAQSLPKQVKSIYEIDTYQWSTGETSAAGTVTGTGTYTVSGSLDGCPILDTIEVVLDDPLVVDLGAEKVNNCEVGQLQPVVLRNVGQLPNYVWSLPSLGEDSLVVKYPNTYRLTSTNACGSFVDEVEILGCEPSDIYVPNVFKPDAIGENNHFMAYGWNWTFETLQVFDAWGHLVYSETNPIRGWDGYIKDKKANTGVYVWILTYHGINDDKILKKYGDVTVVW